MTWATSCALLRRFKGVQVGTLTHIKTVRVCRKTETAEGINWNLSWRCPENVSPVSPEWATMLKEMSFGCFFFLSFLVVNSLWRQEVVFFFHYWLWVTFECLLMWERHIWACLSSQSIFRFFAVAVSTSVPAHSIRLQVCGWAGSCL